MTAQLAAQGATKTCMTHNSCLKIRTMCHRHVRGEGTWHARRTNTCLKTNACHTTEAMVAAKEHGTHEGAPVSLSKPESLPRPTMTNDTTADP